MKLNTYLYMMSQKELILYIKRILTIKKIPFETDEHGNIWSIRYKDKPLFNAHLDTVNRSDIEFNMPVFLIDGKLSRPGYVLGADDRAGVNIILANLNFPINFAFFTDEEIGRIGSTYAMTQPKFTDALKENINFIVTLDRKGRADVLGHTHGYCDKELDDKMCEVIGGGYKSARGSVCDLDSIRDVIQGVNLSIGYEGAHTAAETLVVDDWEYICDRIHDINNIEGVTQKPAPPKAIYTYTGHRGYTGVGKQSRTSYDGGYWGGGYSSYYYDADENFLADDELDTLDETSIMKEYYKSLKPQATTLEVLEDEDISTTKETVGAVECSVCLRTMEPGEDYYEVMGVNICEDCIEAKYVD